MAIGTTAFPTSLDTVVELVEIKNNASSTLSGNVLIGDVTIGVTDIAEFPTTGFGTLTDDLTTPTKTEIISWTGISGSNLTGCTRGAQGTSAAAFSSGNFIEVRPTAGHHEALRGAVIAIETKIGSGSAIAVNKLAALTASRLMVTDASGFASAASVTATEAGYLSGVTSAIQTQLGNKQGLDATLTALAAYNTNGILTQTAADTFAGRTITGTSAKIDVSNGDGVSGNPTLTISATYVGQTSITTLGTVTTGTLSTGAVIGGVTMTLGSDADGDIYYRSSGVLTRLAKGTALQQLRINAGATAPEWATISGGGGGDALVANPLSQFAATTSLQLAGVISDETGSGALVFANTPTLVTPVLGVATATSINKVTITAPATSATLTLSDGSSLITSGGHAITLTSTGATNVTLPTTGTLVNSAVTSLSSLTTVGTITSGGLGTGAVLGGVTMTLGSDADGDIYYRSSNVLTRLAKGTALQQLRMNAGATAPEWAAAGGGITIGTTAITSGTAGRILYETSGNVVGEIAGSSVDANGAVQFAATARSSGVAQYFRINTPADTGQTASTGSVGAYFGGNGSGATVTRTWAAGTVASQSENVFVAPTYAGASATANFTTAATVSITGAPGVGANAAITAPYAFWVQSGRSFFSGNIGIGSVGTAPTAAVYIDTVTAGAEGLYVKNGSTAAGNVYSGVRVANSASQGILFKLGTNYSTFGTLAANDLGFYNSTSGNISIVNDVAAGKILLTTGARTAADFIIETTGAIGINKPTGIAAQLHIVSSAAGTVGLRVDSAATPSVDIFQLTNNGSNRYTVNSSATATTATVSDVSGGTQVRGTLTESVTLSTGGATTDSTIDLPANSIILSVTGRITTTITTATDWKLGDATVADRFSDANATMTAGTTTVGINQWKADRTTAGQGAFQQSTAKVRITTTGTPGAGVIRITIHYITLSAPTS